MAYLSRLTLNNFRSFSEIDLKLPSGVVALYGPNAQGKTTLLEAVYLMAIARSFRAENERELVNFQAAIRGEQALVGGILEQNGERIAVYIGYQPFAADRPDHESASAGTALSYSVQKRIHLNRLRRTAADLVGVVGVVLFSAEDIELIQGPPSARRRYLDILISLANPMYLQTLQRYQKVLRQRNQLLRLLKDGRAQLAELEYWDLALSQDGAWLTWQRGEAMKPLAALCAEHHQSLGSAGQRLEIQYQPSVAPGDSIETTQPAFRYRLEQLQARELATGQTAAGPHRDDFKLFVNGVDMGSFASRGDARTLALTLRLAEASYLAAVRDDEPIVLLDDVLSEMDSERRRRVLKKIAGYRQSLITTTDVEPLQEFFGADAAYFRVAGGKVIADRPNSLGEGGEPGKV